LSLLQQKRQEKNIKGRVPYSQPKKREHPPEINDRFPGSVDDGLLLFDIVRPTAVKCNRRRSDETRHN
jgi:hypothetical protein